MKEKRPWRIESLALSTGHALTFQALESVEIPFSVLVGDKREPVALVMAGVHGDEYEGPAAILDLAREIDPSQIHGAIILVPIANPQAFAAATRRHPVDNEDLNRSFPGDEAGGPTQRLAYTLVNEFVLAADCILSLHGWSKEALVLPYAEFPAVKSEAADIARRAAESMGFQYLYPYDWQAGVLGNTALAYGIPIVEAEIGGAGTITPEGQKLYRQAILRFLDHFKILEFSDQDGPETILIGHQPLQASHAGLFQSLVSIGEGVVAGQQLGYVRGLNGSVLESVDSPAAGLVGVMRTLASVQPDDLLFHLFTEREDM